MKQALKLHIPEPCHENWSNMNPTEQGRFCLSCQKTVVDFTSMTDRQVLEYFSNYTGDTCGRFQGDQLNRTIAVGAQKPTGWWKYMLSLLMPAILISSRSAAQGGVKAEKVVCTSSEEPKLTTVTLGRTIPKLIQNKVSTVTGMVMDEQGNPVPGASVVVKGTRMGAATDNNGAFILKHNLPLPVTLEINSVGFSGKEIVLDKKYNPALPIHVKMEAAWLGEVIIVGSVRPKKTVFHQFKQFIADSIRKQSFKIYPNPVATGALVKTTGKLKKGDYYIRVIDTHGRLLQEERIDIMAEQLNVSFNLHRNILAGHYTVLLLDNKKKQVGTQQLIVN